MNNHGPECAKNILNNNAPEWEIECTCGLNSLETFLDEFDRSEEWMREYEMTIKAIQENIPEDRL